MQRNLTEPWFSVAEPPGGVMDLIQRNISEGDAHLTTHGSHSTRAVVPWGARDRERDVSRPLAQVGAGERTCKVEPEMMSSNRILHTVWESFAVQGLNYTQYLFL